MRDAYRLHEDAIVAALCASPRVQPYADPCSGGGGHRRYELAQELRTAWRREEQAARAYRYPHYVRCVKVDWDSLDRPFIYAGLYDGTVWSRTVDYEEPAPRKLGEGHADGQVLAIDANGTFVLSGSGEPSYNRSEATNPTLRIVNLCTFPHEVAHELGADAGGHTDSINDILILSCSHDDATHKVSCTAVTAASDGLLIVWDVVAGKALHRCTPPADYGLDGAVTAIARVDDQTLLSCGADGVLLEWILNSDTHELTVARAMSTLGQARSPHSCPLSAMSYHRETCTITLGNHHGEIGVFRLSPRHHRRDELCYPLTNWKYTAGGNRGTQLHGHVLHEVASIQHDGDKVVCNTREGLFRVFWFDGPLPDEGMPIGMLRSGELAARTAPSTLPKANLIPDGFAASVRMYVSSVSYCAHTIIADGFDNKVIIIDVTRDVPDESGPDE